MEKLYQKSVPSPLGYLILGGSEVELKYIRFSDYPEDDTLYIPEILLRTQKQLSEYFEGSRFSFDLKLNPEGTDFQKKVWELVQHVPFGETSTYKDIARKLGGKTYIRAVGKANATNPIPVIIPCHRIIGSNGKLVGYAGGTGRKKQLLLHEIKLKKGTLF